MEANLKSSTCLPILEQFERYNNNVTMIVLLLLQKKNRKINFKLHVILCWVFFSDYLCNVFDDLGIQATDTLKNIDLLLKATPDTFHDISENMPQRLAHAIGNMRHIEL